MTTKARQSQIDWLLLEARIRSALREYAQQDISSFKTLRIIDENLAALTLRGNELPADNLPFVSFSYSIAFELKADRVVGEEQDKIWQGTGVSRGVVI